MRFSICVLHILSLCLFSSLSYTHEGHVVTGMDNLMSPSYHHLLKGKRVGLITNHTAINQGMLSSIDLMKARAQEYGYTLIALFGPEHGIDGFGYAFGSDTTTKNSYMDGDIHVYNLHDQIKRPTPEMLKGIDTLVFDIQDIGVRHYTFISTMFYTMEEAAKHKIHYIVADRPNPINGIIVDGPVLEESQRSFVGYVNVPLCHGMTVGRQGPQGPQGRFAPYASS